MGGAVGGEGGLEGGLMGVFTWMVGDGFVGGLCGWEIDLLLG